MQLVEEIDISLHDSLNQESLSGSTRLCADQGRAVLFSNRFTYWECGLRREGRGWGDVSVCGYHKPRQRISQMIICVCPTAAVR